MPAAGDPWLLDVEDVAGKLGVDRATEDVMARPPRRPEQPIIEREMQLAVLFVGAVMAAVTLLTLDLMLPGGNCSSSDHATGLRNRPRGVRW